MGVALLDSSAVVAYLVADDSLHACAATEIESAVRDAVRSAAPGAKLRTPDALILATAVADPTVDRILTGDARWARVPGVAATVIVLTAA